MEPDYVQSAGLPEHVIQVAESRDDICEFDRFLLTIGNSKRAIESYKYLCQQKGIQRYGTIGISTRHWSTQRGTEQRSSAGNCLMLRFVAIMMPKKM